MTCEGSRRGKCVRSTVRGADLRRILGCASSRCSRRRCGGRHSDHLHLSDGLSGIQRHHAETNDGSNRRLPAVSTEIIINAD